jgi:ribose transport system ATP-binding protein
MVKDYPGARALDGVDFALRAGEVHALVGENGAGKSTLMRLLGGITKPTSGQMFLDGAPYAPASRHVAERLGIRFVMQELNLVSTLSVAENIFLDALPSRFGFVRRAALEKAARAAMAAVGLTDIDPRTPVGSLGVGEQQMVEIARGLAGQCRVLILDEPTASLTDREAELLFENIARLRGEGIAVVYISHRMEEILRLADRVTILRDGQVVSTHAARDLTIDEIVRRMVGRDIGEADTVSTARPGPPLLRVEKLCLGARVRDVSFSVQPGEILGFAGLMGSGRTETMRAVFGADRPGSGRIYLGGSDMPARIRSPRDAVRLGLALLTEDRKGQGLLLPRSIRENVTLAHMRSVSGASGWIRRGTEAAAARQWVERLTVRCANTDQAAGELSGGNQQKVVLARWLHRDCRVIIFDEPTRGIDVGAKFELYKLMRELAAAGKALVVVSSDLKELLGLCDRIAVMSAGRVAEVFARGAWTEDKIMAAALSGHLGGSAVG